ncbi:MmgE/PrpD family protein [Jiangella asiatica]|nr:MmgE/PrpD family protein [Jiangella asiatica]
MGATRDLAGMIERGTGGRTTDRSAALVERSILDWLGCAISGSMTDAAQVAAEYARSVYGGGECHVVGSTLRLDAGAAAWLNGIQGHVDDFDDSGSHPASYLTPTVLALGEETSAPAARVIEAWTIGYEIAMRLCNGIRPDRGWHTTPLYGTLGATAAACVLLDLPRDRIEHALGMAGSATGGLMRNFGSMTKAMHPANAARSGIEAARLARLGYEATPGVIEGRYGLVDCFGGPKAHVPSISALPSDPLFIDRQPPVIKAWPCCTGTHRSLTAALSFAEEFAPAPDDIVQVNHYGPLIPGKGALQYRDVATPTQGKFSLEYTLAAALIDGRVDHDTYSIERFGRGDIQALMARIHRHRSPEAELQSARTAEGMDVDVLTIELRDGRVHTMKLGPRRVLDGAEVADKFAANAARGRIRATAPEVVQAIRTLEQAASIAPLMAMVSSPSTEQERDGR